MWTGRRQIKTKEKLDKYSPFRLRLNTSDRKKVMRKRSTRCAPKERTAHRLKGGPGWRVRKVAFELNGWRCGFVRQSRQRFCITVICKKRWYRETFALCILTYTEGFFARWQWAVPDTGKALITGSLLTGRSALPVSDKAKPATDTLNTWRGIFEPSEKACCADGAKRNRGAARRGSERPHEAPKREATCP